ncbi:MAG: T9SS type A sorting domain-containing protein, partial [Sphingobacteriia bacterium]|nr:T9SS type A sorting domain-containing protein [Sphingobacteriia bacterium]
ATPDVTTLYTITVDDGENTISESYTLTVNLPPVVDLGEDQSVCADQSVVLDATTPNAASYLWTPGGYTTPIIEVDSTGIGYGAITYICEVTDNNGCVGEDDVEITFVSCIGISEINNNLSLFIYPNPATNQLSITLKGFSESVDYTLLNYQGQNVYNKYIGQLQGTTSETIQLTDFAPGIYYLRLNTSEEVIIKKVVIQ